MPLQRPPRRPRSYRPPRLARALAASGLGLAVAGCSHITPLGPYHVPPALLPVRDLGSPIIMQAMRSRPPAPTGRCPADSVDLVGSDPHVPRAIVRSAPAGRKQLAPGAGGPAAPSSTAGSTAPPAPLAGVACFLPVGKPVTITSASVTPVTTSRFQQGPAQYEFVVAFPAADVPAMTALFRRAYDSGDDLGMSVAGRLWQAPQPRGKITALRAEQVNLLSRTQAQQLHRLLVPSG